MLILNDIHIGVQRKAGTTPASQAAMRDYLFKSLSSVLTDSQESHLCIPGDLFDEFEVSPRDWLQTYMLLSSWLAGGYNTLTLIAGNHDHSPKAERQSSFQVLAKVLNCQYGDDKVAVVGIDEWSLVGTGVIALAHCSNQDVFNAKLEEIINYPQLQPALLLHANFDNNFAVESDHSLNVSKEWAGRFAEKGVTLIFAHEHQAREIGNVKVLGNQWPTSVADCLGNDAKYAHVLNLTQDGISLKPIETWHMHHEFGFMEIDWRHLGPIAETNVAGFVKVVGEAKRSEASEVINAIAAYRKAAPSETFVITNGVKIEGIVEVEDLPQSFEVAKKFDVLAFIKQHLEPEEWEAVDALLKVEA